jgi:alpha-amylase
MTVSPPFPSPAPPIRFCFGLHLHQPVGNFGYVFEQHVNDVYLPFLQRLEERDFFPVALHVSGPLIEWMSEHDTRFLDLLGRLAGDGKLELLLAGFYEPVLASLPRADRVEQILWMREALETRFGVDARGLWLTERVWEPDLAADLAKAGVRFGLVDDRHFLVSGFEREQLHAPYWTEHDGQGVALFPIDERLRYLIPFQPPEDTIAYLRGLRQRGHRLAVLADDGEKFGGWPGTREWVYDKGWLTAFLTVMQRAVDEGEVILSSFDAALRDVPSGGLAYLPTASYREMEGWSLPPEGALRLIAREEELGTERLTGAEGALVRGSHWRNFLVKYRESNRMHKKMLALSRLCREHGNPRGPRRAIGRAQCNDAYWHGVFGGLYLPFLRAAVWENLALAEESLRQGEALECEERDIDFDGNTELWIHSASFSAIVSPARGGAVEELTRFGERANLADALTRRREAYHVTAQREAARQRAAKVPANEKDTMGAGPSPSEREAPSIHDLEHNLSLEDLPPVDVDDRAIFVERVLPESATAEAFAGAAYTTVASAVRLRLTYGVSVSTERVVVTLRAADGTLEKTLSFSPEGQVWARFVWNPALFPSSAWFSTEVSLDRDRAVTASSGSECWTYPIETVAKSERGLDHTRQGMAYVIRWPVSQGMGEVTIPLTVRSPEPGAPAEPRHAQTLDAVR